MKNLLDLILYNVGENEKEYIYKCPLHDDHNGNPKKGHLYISKSDLSFICFKCGVKGKNIINFLVKNNSNLVNIKKENLNNFFLTVFTVNHKIMDTQYNKENNENTNENIQSFYEMIDYLYTKTLRKYQKILIEYFNEKRKIYNQSFIKELIHNKKILFYDNTPQQRELVLKYYNRKLMNEGIFINFNSFDNLTTNSQIRFLNPRIKTKYINLIYSTPIGVVNKNVINSSLPFVVFITEGIFDNIKLDYFLDRKNNYLIFSMLGKNNYKSFDLLKKYIELHNIIVSHLFIVLDNDVTNQEIEKSYKEFNKRIYIPEKNVYIRMFNGNNKDLDDMEKIDLKFVEYNLYLTDLIKLKLLKRED